MLTRPVCAAKRAGGRGGWGPGSATAQRRGGEAARGGSSVRSPGRAPSWASAKQRWKGRGVTAASVPGEGPTFRVVACALDAAADHVEQRALAAAGGAQYGTQPLPRADARVDAAQDRPLRALAVAELHREAHAGECERAVHCTSARRAPVVVVPTRLAVGPICLAVGHPGTLLAVADGGRGRMRRTGRGRVDKEQTGGPADALLMSRRRACPPPPLWSAAQCVWCVWCVLCRVMSCCVVLAHRRAPTPAHRRRRPHVRAVRAGPLRHPRRPRRPPAPGCVASTA